MTTITPDFSEVAAAPERKVPKEMLTVTEKDGVTHVRINSSSLGIILSCMRKSQYSLELGLKAKNESPALIFGSAIHKALEVFYSHGSRNRTFPANFKELSDLQGTGNTPKESHFLFDAVRSFVDTNTPNGMLPSSDKHSTANGIWILQEYFRTYLNDPYVVAVDSRGPITERTCETEIYRSDTLTITLFGTIDVVLRNEADGTILPADHKTTSQMGSDFFNRIRPNHQYTGYMLLAQRVLGVTADSFLVNGIQKKAKPVTSRGTGPHFARQVTRRTPEDIAEFIDSVVYAVRTHLAARASGKWPLGHVDACGMYGGCTYLAVCSAPNALRQNLIDAQFVRTT